MPFRLPVIEAICQLTDLYLAGEPVTEAAKRRIWREANQIVAANEFVAASGIDQLSDTTVAALVVLLIQ